MIKILLKDNRINVFLRCNINIKEASRYSQLEIVKLLLEKTMVESYDCFNYTLKYTAPNYDINLFKFLLNDSKEDLSADNNYSIELANKRGYNDIIEILWNDKRVKDSLKNHNPYLYKELKIKDIKNKINDF
jgi:hypothetical protein